MSPPHTGEADQRGRWRWVFRYRAARVVARTLVIRNSAKSMVAEGVTVGVPPNTPAFAVKMYRSASPPALTLSLAMSPIEARGRVSPGMVTVPAGSASPEATQGQRRDRTEDWQQRRDFSDSEEQIIARATLQSWAVTNWSARR